VAAAHAGGGPGPGASAAARAALDAAGVAAGDLAAIELHEASAAQALGVMAELDLPRDRVNPAGGAIARGNPLAAAGAILLVRLLSELERRGGGIGLAAVSSTAAIVSLGT
jgi:acetyl-CoA acetyltransferase